MSIVRDQLGLAPTGRPAKSTPSIIEKLRRESIRLTQIQDIAGCRLIVTDISEQNTTVDVLKKALPDCVVVDRREKPSHGSRAVHVVVSGYNRTVEIQVRTEMQHIWAELSEKMSDVIDPSMKYGGGPAKQRRVLDQASEVVRAYESLQSIAIGLDDEDTVRARTEMAISKDAFLTTIQRIRSIIDSLGQTKDQ